MKNVRLKFKVLWQYGTELAAIQGNIMMIVMP